MLEKYKLRVFNEKYTGGGDGARTFDFFVIQYSRFGIFWKRLAPNCINRLVVNVAEDLYDRKNECMAVAKFIKVNYTDKEFKGHLVAYKEQVKRLEQQEWEKRWKEQETSWDV
jgi:hypothetical protein